MSVLNNNWKVYTDPTYPRADPLMFSPRFPPSAVERMAALEDPEIAARIKAWDEARARYFASFQFETVDFVADESCPKAYPLPPDVP